MANHVSRVHKQIAYKCAAKIINYWRTRTDRHRFFDPKVETCDLSGVITSDMRNGQPILRPRVTGRSL